VSGRQAWSSGVVHAEWIFFTGMLVDGDQPPAPWMFCIPRADVEVIDTWFITGMQGTGSQDVAVDAVFVPEHRAMPYMSLLDGTHHGTQTHENPLYHLPAATVLGFETIGVLAGTLRGAANEFLKLTKARITSYTGSSVATKPAAQMRIGRAFAAADAVDLLVRDMVQAVVGLTDKNSLDTAERARLRMRTAQVTSMACDGINDIIHGAGGNSFRHDAPLQRFFRDINVLRTHAALDIETASEISGRVLLGMDPGGPV
jgi:3-hydroxy-9,10-secoandrosta-1,3,5(10)-triene-9,17-dione monooxygenase